MLTQCSRRGAAQHYKMNSFMHKIGLHKLGSKRPLSSTAPAPAAKCVPDMTKAGVATSGASPFAKSAADSMKTTASSHMRASSSVKRPGVKFAVQFPQEVDEAKANDNEIAHNGSNSSSSTSASSDGNGNDEESKVSAEESKGVQFNQRVKVFVYKLSDEELTWKRENNATRLDLSVM
ncbi:Hypothetical Protein FCC1311_098102 [Hondaea fermentalgiana]|uniref:Uncharacterized protein n=1 Tax=Hondaea fermentalgiana TaxID=2315210 RepID=A0A2R5GRS7_9STRA|nr:Hypothetical Protein FCC1311_098102 [Hondaea fermentalgiana]|eukprot:GBG33587.1 Hypothetical Protein FCC1311_098102 [Hondaea fermentalgiana]